MKGKIKIRTMKDDLANANDDKNKNLTEAKQDQNKPDIDTAEISGFSAMSGATPDKLKDEEIGELKNLIKRISKDDKETSKERPVKTEKGNIATNIENKETISEERADSKNDEKEDLKNLINKISETIDKEDDKPIQIENTDDKLNKDKESEIEETEENKQSFWSDISEKLKDDESVKSQKGNGDREKNQTTIKTVESIESVSEKKEEEKHDNSGILTTKKLFEKERNLEDKGEIRKTFYDNDNNYQSPENRLIFGKQKKYSSVSKRIKLKDKKDEIENLKNADEIKEKQKIISESEKYKKLKSRVIKKYNIRLFSLPWKKIIPISVFLIILSGAVYYVLVRELSETPPEPPVVIIGTEVERLAKIRNAVELTKDEIVGTTDLERIKINEKFNSNEGIEELRIVIRQDGNIISLKEALKSVRIETENFPKDFWDTTNNSYNLFAIKTGEDNFRFGIAIESNDIASLLKTMGDWEQEDVDKRKMFYVFEPFFTDSEIEEDFGQNFRSTNYEYNYIRYINLPDQNISFDYFASDNILTIVTSKENTSRIIDILNDDVYDYDDSYENYDDYYDEYDEYEYYDDYEN